jgi:hypothetical protein
VNGSHLLGPATRKLVGLLNVIAWLNESVSGCPSKEGGCAWVLDLPSDRSTHLALMVDGFP